MKSLRLLWSIVATLPLLLVMTAYAFTKDFVQALGSFSQRMPQGFAFANVLTNLAPDIYKAADMIARELVGIVPSIVINGDGSERVAKGQPVRSHFTRPVTVNTTFAPAMVVPEGTDQTVDNKTLTVNQYASVQIPWTGEDVKYINNGVGFETVYGDQIVQAMRAIVNKIEGYVWGVMRVSASRAFGTAGTTPFASNFNEMPQIRKILVDNGCPDDKQLTLAMDTTAGANLRSLAQLQKVNEAGNDLLLRRGTLLDLQGIMLKESAGISVVTKGTGAGYLVNNGAGYPVGTTVITVDTGAGTILAGDVVTFAGDTNKYVAVGLVGGVTLTIGGPGLRQAVADNTAITVGNNFTANLAFHRQAAEVVMRAPAMPSIGDSAVDKLVVQDPWSGLTFEIAAYRGYMKAMFEVRCLYDAAVWKPEFIAPLLG
jgi:hypothetical protein